MKRVNEPRAQDFSHFQIIIRGVEYHYVDAFSQTSKRSPNEATCEKGIVLLLHGFPDLWFGWRYQIKALVKAGYRVIAPDLVGYGGTQAPLDLKRYTFQSVGQDMIELIDRVSPRNSQPNFYIGCHDWGGMVGWRMAQYHPHRLLGLVSFCTSFQPTNAEWIPTEDLVERLPNLSYQLLFEDRETDEILDANCDDLFDIMFYNDEKLVSTERLEEANPFIAAFKAPQPLKTSVDVTFHKQQYKQKGFTGAMNWYRTRKLNHDEETLALKQGKMLKAPRCPCMLVIGLCDAFLTPKMAAKIKTFLPDCRVESIDASHWVLVENPTESSNLLVGFLDTLSRECKSKL
jgi:soluble epoxide hydrolase/lipid-phosphate phosphatase